MAMPLTKHSLMALGLILGSSMAFASDPMQFAPDQAMERHSNGMLRLGVASKAQVIAGISVPKGTFVWFDAKGRLDTVSFPEKRTYYGLVIEADGFTSFFDPGNGKRAQFKAGKLASDQTFQAFHLKGGTEVTFYESGDLLSGQTTRDMDIHGVKLRAGEHFILHPNGYISEIHNEWGMGRWDEKGLHMGHKQLLRSK